MKITHRIMSIALAFVMCTGLICTVNANENNGEMYFNFTKESNSESAVQDTEASETQTTEKTQQTWGSIGGYYTVKRGDTLAGISKKMYQSYNYIEMIAEANGIDNVDEIYPGQILEIPQIED